MGPTLARRLSEAWLLVTAAGLGPEADPLRLELPPDGGDVELAPREAGVLGALYLLAELERCDAVPAAELLASRRWDLGLRDPAAVAALESFAERSPRWPGADARDRLYARLFGATADGSAAGAPAPAVVVNDAFEELLAGYCQAVVAFDPRGLPRSGRVLRTVGDRLRANLAPRQYGNTLVVAPALVEQLRAALDLLALPGIGALFGTTGTWNVLRALHGDATTDIGRRVDRGRAGQTVVASTGVPLVPDAVDGVLVEAASRWLTATGFDLRDGA